MYSNRRRLGVPIRIVLFSRMKLAVLFLVLSMVVLMAEPGEGIIGRIFRWGSRIIRGGVRGAMRGMTHTVTYDMSDLKLKP